MKRLLSGIIIVTMLCFTTFNFFAEGESSNANEFENTQVNYGKNEEQESDAETVVTPTTPITTFATGYSEVIVATEAELINELNNVVAEKTITITMPLQLTNTINLDLAHNQNITIKGAGSIPLALTSAAGKKHFSLFNGTGTLAFENIAFVGNIEDTNLTDGKIDLTKIALATSGGGIMGSAPELTINFDNTLFTKIKNPRYTGSASAFAVGAKVANFTNTSFITNFSGEGGAAIMNDSGSLMNTIINISSSSFIDNVGDGSGPVGGAIEVNGNSKIKSTVTFDSNTIVNNTAEKGNALFGRNSGGGISFRYATGMLIDNIISGNTAFPNDSNFQNIRVESNSEAFVDIKDSNIIDGNLQDIFGIYTPTLIEAGTLVGNLQSDHTTYQKVLSIKPEGSADDLGKSDVSMDQAYYGRDISNTPDIGAVEIKWVKHIVNHPDSYFTLALLPHYDGSKYYEQVNPQTIYDVYRFNETNMTTAVKPLAVAGMEFIGWNTEIDGTGVMYAEEEVLTFSLSNNITLYGQWRDATQFSITYDGNGATTGGPVVDPSTYSSGASVTVLANTFTYSGYEFKGWNTLADGTGVMYQPNTTFTITGDIVLYAIWQPQESLIEDPITPTLPTTGEYQSEALAFGILLVITGGGVILLQRKTRHYK